MALSAFTALLLVSSLAAVHCDDSYTYVRGEGLSQTRDSRGQYDSKVRTHDGGYHNSEGHLVTLSDGSQVLVQSGSYSQKKADGSDSIITYLADHNGYQASGSAIPTQAVV